MGNTLTGTGIGLRGPHIPRLLNERPAIPWLEALTDNHLAPAGPVREQLRAVRQYWPVTLHCVGMSIGGTDPIDYDYLSRIRALKDEIEPAWISDHLCWTSVDGQQMHDLMPLPYTEATLKHVSDRVLAIQDYLQCIILVENVSSYFKFRDSSVVEAEFLSELTRITGCGLLLDVCNAWVSASNHVMDARAFLEQLPLDRVAEIHLAGFDDQGDHLLDAHNAPVPEGVWELFAWVMQRRPEIPALVEWDRDLPDLDELIGEARRADAIRAAQTSKYHA
mgnify:CR=1 FL=1